MKYHELLIALSISISALPATAQITPLGPRNTSGSGDFGMKHAGVSLNGTILNVSIPAPPASPVTMTNHGFGANYADPKFDVLEDVYYNAQHGWNPDGFLSLPSDRFIWMERTGSTQPAGSIFKVYDGGRMQPGEETMADWSMAEIYSSSSPLWQWDAKMQHDYFVADKVGNYSMSFKVYLGDDSGVMDTNYTPASATFEFVVVPEPSAFALSLLSCLSLTRLRRI